MRSSQPGQGEARREVGLAAGRGGDRSSRSTTRHIDFTLRKGIQFTGGFGELTAEDVKFSFERIADPKNESPYKDDWAVLDRVEVKDPYSGTIVLKEPFAPLVDDQPGARLGLDRLEARRSKPAGGKFTTEPPATSGPYVLKEWQPKQRTILARNPDFYGPAPDFEEIHIFPIEDEKTAEIAFEAGELDYTAISACQLAARPEGETSPRTRGSSSDRRWPTSGSA